MKSIFLSLSLILVFSGCTNYKRPYTKPSPVEIFSKIGNSNIKNIRSQGRADVMLSGTKRANVKVFLIFERNGKMRFEAMTPPPMNSTVMLLTSDATSFKANDKEHNVFYQGKSDKCSVKSVMGIPLSPTELFNYLIASPNIKFKNAVLRWDSKTGNEVITVKFKNKIIKMWVNGKNGKNGWRLSKVEIKDNKEKLKIEYRGYKKYGHSYLPKRIRISKPSHKGDVVFSWQKLEINIETDPEAYDQNPPAEATIKRIICQ